MKNDGIGYSKFDEYYYYCLGLIFCSTFIYLKTIYLQIGFWIYFCIKFLAIIKVISTLLRNAPETMHLYDIKLRFIDDLILLASASHENRR